MLYSFYIVITVPLYPVCIVPYSLYIPIYSVSIPFVSPPYISFHLLCIFRLYFFSTLILSLYFNIFLLYAVCIPRISCVYSHLSGVNLFCIPPVYIILYFIYSFYILFVPFVFSLSYKYIPSCFVCIPPIFRV